VLLWTGGVFVLAQLVGGLLLDHCWPDVRFPQAGAVLTRLKASARTPEVVIMGSSRFEGAVRPEVLDPLLWQYTRQGPRVFNAALGAGDAVVAERLLGRMLDAGRRPALLVLEVSPEHVGRHSPLLSQQVMRQMTWPDLPGYLPDACIHGPVMRLLSSRLLPLYLHRYQIRKQTLAAALALLTGTAPEAPAAPERGPHPVPDLSGLPSVGPGVPPVPPGGTPPLAAGAIAGWLRDYELSPIVTAALERLLGGCRAEGIDVLLVGVPAREALRALYTPAVNATYLGYMRSLTVGDGCRFVDFRDRVPEHGFSDSLHLTDDGAAHFSRLLAREVLIPLWRELHP
jgi:hypothetical protein